MVSERARRDHRQAVLEHQRVEYSLYAGLAEPLSRDRLLEEMKRALASDDVPDDWSPLLKTAARLAWSDGHDSNGKRSQPLQLR
jgi:hypothetical protein